MARIGNDGGFQRALARFKSHLSPAEQESFGVTSLQDVQKTIVQIQNTQGSQSKMRNLTRIKAFVEAMEQYGKVVEVFLNASSILAFVWGPIKFLLQIASTWADSFDVLLDAYEEISENIPQLLEYGEIFNRHAHMRKVLELMYGDILEFHRRALTFFRRPTWKKLFHSSWKTFKTQFQYILSSLSRHKSLIENQASLLEYEQSKIARVAAKNSFEGIAEAEKKRRSLAVTDKIRPPNSRFDQDKAKETRQEYPESGKWILRHAFLRDWMDPNRTNLPLLWVNGIPGAGKTVIASLIIEETEAISSVVVGFFYCRYSDNQKNSFNKILRGILAQLVRQNGELLSYVYDACCTSDETTIDSESLLKRLVEVSLRTCASTCTIIDGIDECDELEEKKTIAWFLELCKVINRDNEGSMRLLFISQRDKVTESLLNKASVITLDSKYHQEDIQAYANHWSPRIRQKFDISEASASQISINVAAGAQGLFLFAKLVITNLYNQTTRGKLFRELQPDSFPTGLEAAYERIAIRIFENPNSSEREDAHNIFRWIVCARRPLKWSEIQSIFAIDPVSSRVDFEERQLRVSWRHLCGSLVEVGAGDTLELVHSSAKQYLIKSGRISIWSEELHIAGFCLNYLNFRCFDANLTNSEIRDFLGKGYYSFEDYATAHWLDHLESSTSHSLPLDIFSCESLGEIVNSFLIGHGSDSPPDLTIVNSQKFQSIRHWNFTQTLDALAQLASEKKCNKSYLDVETQLQRRRLIYEDMITGTNPLGEVSQRFLLSGSGCYKCPKIWCGYFADGFQRREDRDKHVDQHERPFRCSFDECIHAELGFESEKALKRHEKTSHRNGQDSEWVFPTMKPKKPLDIFSASAKGDLDTVERLVGEGVDINKTTKPKGSITAISLAVKHCRPQIVSYLIGQGCKSPGSAVLDLAIKSNPTDIVQKLLEMEVNSDIKKKRAQHALYTAASSGREEVVYLLLTYNIDINKQDEQDANVPSRTALDLARMSGNDNIVQILLDNGAQSETEEAEQTPTPTPTTPVTPMFAPSKANGNGTDNVMTSMASDPTDQLVPLEGMFENGEVFPRDFKPDRSTFQDIEPNTMAQRRHRLGQPQRADPTFSVSKSSPTPVRDAQALAQAQEQMSQQQHQTQQQRDLHQLMLQQQQQKQMEHALANNPLAAQRHAQAQQQRALQHQLELQQQQQQQQQQANGMVSSSGNQGIIHQQFLHPNAAMRNVDLTPHLQKAQQRTHRNAQLAHEQREQARLWAQQQAASQQQEDTLKNAQQQTALQQQQQQAAFQQYLSQKASQAAIRQDPPSTLPPMIVQSPVPPVPDPVAAAAAARQQQQQQEQQEQQIAAQQQRPQRDSESDLLLNRQIAKSVNQLQAQSRPMHTDPRLYSFSTDKS